MCSKQLCKMEWQTKNVQLPNYNSKPSMWAYMEPKFWCFRENLTYSLLILALLNSMWSQNTKKMGQRSWMKFLRLTNLHKMVWSRHWDVKNINYKIFKSFQLVKESFKLLVSSPSLVLFPIKRVENRPHGANSLEFLECSFFSLFFCLKRKIVFSF